MSQHDPVTFRMQMTSGMKSNDTRSCQLPILRAVLANANTNLPDVSG